MPPEDKRSLEDLLDAAGRSVQPTHPGWQQLPGRLARLPQKLRRLRRRWWLVAAGAGAAAAAALLALLLAPPSRVQADPGPIQVQCVDIELTVLSSSDTDETLYMPLLQQVGRYLTGAPELANMPMAVRDGIMPVPQPAVRRTGQALVKDHRLVLNLQAGDNVVRFTDVAASIDPTSVRFVSATDPDGTKVVEQNFEYDLATADALLHRYIDREITCIARDGQETSGYLVASDPQNLVLATESAPAPGKPRTTQTLTRGTLQAIRLKDVPPDLLVKPTLVWKLRARAPGRHDTTLSYLCGLIKWQADYVAVVTPGDDRNPDLLDVTGWVSLDNSTGSTYEKARLKLIAGDVNRVHDPWAPVPPQSAEVFRDLADKLSEINADGKAIGKEFIEKSFFEYHLYTLSAPSTVRDREAKQLNLLHCTGVKAARRYVYDSYTDGRRVAVELVARNEKENGLGLPLPKGRVTLEQRDQDGESAFLGSTEIDHTAVKEELTLRYGSAFDVAGDFKETAPHQYEMRVRNHQTSEIQVRAIAHMAAGWRLTFSSEPFQQHDVETAYFDFPLKPNAEQVIAYTLGNP